MLLKGKVNYRTQNLRLMYSLLLSRMKNIRHSVTQNLYLNATIIEFLILFFAQYPTCHEYVVKVETSANIRLPASSHLSDFRTIQKHLSTPCRGTTPLCCATVGPRCDLLYFCFLATDLPLSFSSSFRERRWKRWLRGTEKLIISDTNLSGLLGGW